MKIVAQDNSQDFVFLDLQLNETGKEAKAVFERKKRRPLSPLYLTTSVSAPTVSSFSYCRPYDEEPYDAKPILLTSLRAFIFPLKDDI